MNDADTSRKADEGSFITMKLLYQGHRIEIEGIIARRSILNMVVVGFSFFLVSKITLFLSPRPKKLAGWWGRSRLVLRGEGS